VSEEDFGDDSAIAPEERSNPPHVEQVWLTLYSRPTGIAVGKQAGIVQGIHGKALETIERHMPLEWEKGKEHLGTPAIHDIPAGDLEEMGILVGQVYDERFIEESH
jgi:hypothetical protein